MENNIQVSLITVCFNAESTIEKTLQSAVNQTFTNFELVIVDGGSTDKTVEKIRPFSNFIGTLISEKDNGIYHAMNKGVKAAKGEFVYFLNAGDAFYHSGVLAEVFNEISSTNCDFIYGKVETINEPTGVNYLNGKPVKLEMFYSHYPICHQATFARKSIFDKVGYFDEKLPLVADSEWLIRVFKNEKISKHFTEKIVAFYDVQGASYQKRMKGYREYLHVGFKHFPKIIAIKNVVLYPIIWLKVWFIRQFQETALFKKYREIKFRNKMAAS